MALDFGAAASDRVDVGSPAGFDDENPFTALMWIYPTTLTATRLMLGKQSTGTNGKRIGIDGAGGGVNVRVSRATTATNYITNTLPLATGKWEFVAATFDTAAGAGEVVNIYRGDLRTLAAEAGYGTATDGAGAPTSDAAHNLLWGNDGRLTQAFQGRIAVCAFVGGAALALAQIQSWQFNPRPVVDGIPLTGMWQLGLDPAGVGSQPDLSGNGNAGTVTGATQIDHVPLFQFLEAQRRRARRIARVGQQILRRVG